MDNRIDLAGKDLQVIVKLANIVLTPEKPHYPGGVWHLEGMKNESIVASGICYFKTENITESELAFRRGTGRIEDYEQCDYSGVEAVYGLANDGECNQVIGAVKTIEKRCIAFPNILQHRVSPFSLQDPSKPGYRKIVVFFLIQPKYPILSTSFVPPQQKDWYLHEIEKLKVDGKAPTEYLPNPNLLRYDELAMTIEEARKYRAALMSERKVYTDAFTKKVFIRSVSLCEH